MLIWQILQVVAALVLVLLPYIMQAKESLHPPMNTPSLGTFGIVMMAACYFLVAGIVNAVILSSRLHWPWYGTLGLAIAAAAVGSVGSYWLLYTMATKGGTAWTIAGGVGLAALFLVNLLAPRLAASV